MLNKWIESVFIKRAVLAAITTVVAHLSIHGLPLVIQALAVAGINVTVTFDTAKMAEWSTIALVGMTQGGHEWIAAKYPNLSKYI